MKKFINHTGIIAPLDISNVDTDAIIPKQFLQKIDRTGFQNDLFYNWRFIKGNKNKINKNFCLNQKYYQDASILISRNNFGCGSSREHAVWALLDYGFKVIIAIDFADIFYSNSFQNKLLLITLPEKNIEKIFNVIYKYPGIKATIKLDLNQLIIKNHTYIFNIDSSYRFCLLNGLDEIDLTQKYNNKILEYEKNIPLFFIDRK